MKIPRLSPSIWMSLLCGTAALVVGIILLAADKPWEIIASVGQPKKIKHFVAVYEWWGGAINTLLLIALAATSRWWFRSGPPPDDSWLRAVPTPKWFWPLLLVAMGITAWSGLQRISLSVWDDEEKSLRHFVVGEFRHNAQGTPDYDSKGEPIFRKADWEDAFWNYRFPTNHHLQTIISKASLSVWRAVVRPVGVTFSEPVLRWPLLVAAIASIATLALLLQRLGFARAAVVAAFLLALHPWHIRYAVELRGYIFTLLFGPLMVLCLLQAISTGLWRWWLAFAFAEFALLYAYPGTLYMLVAANVTGLAVLWFRHTPAGRVLHVPRMLVASTLAGMVWLQLWAPNIPQLADYLKTDRALGELNARWHMNAVAHFLSGIPWNNSDNPTLGYPELQWITGDSPVTTVLLFGLAGLLLAAGAIRLATRRPAGWMTAVILLLPALAVYAMARKNNNYLYEWYLIFALPGLCACFALALEWPARFLENSTWTRRAIPVMLALFVIAFAFFTHPARNWLLTHSLQPMKEVVKIIRPSLHPHDPRHPEVITAALSVHLESYDPFIVDVKDIENVTRLAREADASKRPFYIVSGNDLAVSYQYPDLRKFLFDTRYFEQVKKIRGFDPTLTQTVLLYRSGSLSGTP